VIERVERAGGDATAKLGRLFALPDVDDEPLIARPGTRPPGPLKRRAEHAVELAHVPEREGTQERSERRGRRDAVAEQSRGGHRGTRPALVRRAWSRPVPDLLRYLRVLSARDDR
jgi:hypothetical protein